MITDQIELKSDNIVAKNSIIEVESVNYKVLSCRKLCEWLGEPMGYLLTCEKLH